MLFKRLAARVRSVVVGQLVQGVTPKALALTISLGMVLGIFPILGSTTLLCGLAAWGLKLNQPVIQVINFVIAYPLHLALLIPFYAAGQALFGQPAMALSIVGLTRELHHLGVMGFVTMYGLVALRGIVVWALIAGPAAWLIYRAVRPILERLAQRRGGLLPTGTDASAGGAAAGGDGTPGVAPTPAPATGEA